MIIQNMFYDDIDRKINGVVKVDQNTDEVLKQEVKEYVITKDILLETWRICKKLFRFIRVRLFWKGRKP